MPRSNKNTIEKNRLRKKVKAQESKYRGLFLTATRLFSMAGDSKKLLFEAMGLLDMKKFGIIGKKEVLKINELQEKYKKYQKKWCGDLENK